MAIGVRSGCAAEAAAEWTSLGGPDLLATRDRPIAACWSLHRRDTFKMHWKVEIVFVEYFVRHLLCSWLVPGVGG